MNKVTENTKRIIGQRINELLAINDVKQKELAAHLSIPDNTVSYFVKGARVPNTEQIIKIAQYFNVSADYLLGLSDVQTSDTSIKGICEYTGLSEECIDELHKFYKKFDLNIPNNIERNDVFSIVGIAQTEFISAFINQIFPSIVKYLSFRTAIEVSELLPQNALDGVGLRYDYYSNACKASKLDIFETMNDVIISIEDKTNKI